MKFTFNYPELSGLERDLLDSGEISDVAVAVEQAGFDAFALTEHPIPGANWLAHGGHQTLDPFVGLAFAAAVTERIRLLTHLSVVPYRNPFLLAKTAATLDRCSKGRFILGIGTGYHKTEFFALGVDFDERNALFDEALERAAAGVVGRAVRRRGPALHRQGRDPTAATDAGPDPDLDRRQLQAESPARRRGRRAGCRWASRRRSARTPVAAHRLGSTQLGDMIAEVKDFAGDRAGELDFCMSYMGEGMDQPDQGRRAPPRRHRRAGAVGVTSVNVGSAADGTPRDRSTGSRPSARPTSRLRRSCASPFDSCALNPW